MQIWDNIFYDFAGPQLLLMMIVASNVTIAVMMDCLACHEMEYAGRKDPIFADDIIVSKSSGPTKSS